MKIVLLGATGRLGRYLVKELQNRDLDFSTPTHEECSIEYIGHVGRMIEKYNPDLIIHSAGFVDTERCEVQRDLCLETNVLGTYNIV
jgi:dTDP-4-dehydrorhamnose reductase